MESTQEVFQLSNGETIDQEMENSSIEEEIESQSTPKVEKEASFIREPPVYQDQDEFEKLKKEFWLPNHLQRNDVLMGVQIEKYDTDEWENEQ